MMSRQMGALGESDHLIVEKPASASPSAGYPQARCMVACQRN